MSDLNVILGAGVAGTTLAELLIGRDEPVRLVSRSVKPGPIAPQHQHVADMRDPEQARAALAGAATVYACINPAQYHQWGRDLLPLWAGVLDAAAFAATPVVALDNLYAYGPSNEPLREGAATNATDPKGRLRAELGRQLLALHESGRAPVAIVRASDFIGARVVDSALGARVFPRILAGKSVSVLGDPDVLHSYSDIADVALALADVGSDPDAFGRVWHVPSAVTNTTRSVLERAYSLAGTSGKVRRLPRAALRAVGMFNPAIRSLFDTIYQFEAPWVIDASDYTARFGRTGTPLDATLTATLDSFRTPA
jgi:nucleoside-diphosphate-sugar epimerase